MSKQKKSKNKPKRKPMPPIYGIHSVENILRSQVANSRGHNYKKKSK